MGDRANVVVLAQVYNAVHGDENGEWGNPREAVFLYSHWSGYNLPATLKSALERSKDRWNDPTYLARIIFNEMTKGHEMAETGFGISTRLTDNSYPLLVVDCERQVVVEYPEAKYTEVGFAGLNKYKGTPFAEFAGKWKRAR